MFKDFLKPSITVLQHILKIFNIKTIGYDKKINIIIYNLIGSSRSTHTLFTLSDFHKA